MKNLIWETTKNLKIGALWYTFSTDMSSKVYHKAKNQNKLSF